MRFSLTDIAKGFVDVIARELQAPIATAATAAMKDAGDVAKRVGRSSIAAAGFSRKWQNALRVNIYPAQGESLRPAAFIFHKIRYALRDNHALPDVPMTASQGRAPVEAIAWRTYPGSP